MGARIAVSANFANLVEALLKTNSELARTKYKPGSDIDKLIEANDNLLCSLEVE